MEFWKLTWDTMLMRWLKTSFMNWLVAGPWTEKLLKIDKSAKALNDDRKKIFHTFVMKVMFLSKHGQPDVNHAISILSSRVKESNERDWKKLLRPEKYKRWYTNFARGQFPRIKMVCGMPHLWLILILRVILVWCLHLVRCHYIWFNQVKWRWWQEKQNSLVKEIHLISRFQGEGKHDLPR